MKLLDKLNKEKSKLDLEGKLPSGFEVLGKMYID